MSADQTPPPGGNPPAPAHKDVATTMMPAHAGVATTMQPAHGNVATTMMPVGGETAPAPSGPRSSSYAAGESLQVGSHKLTIERLLFVGGQAEVYVVQGGSAPKAVLKLYTQGVRPKPDVLDRWRALPHNAIIGLLDADSQAEPRAWELLAYAEGGALTGPIRDPARLRVIVQQAADSLHTLHTAGGVVHRDVSPENFLWLDTGRTRLVLSDLGSSSILSGGEAKSGTIRGKLPFMAPEELLPMGDGVVIGDAADFYALGIMILTLWAGQHPFVGREADQIALKSRGAVPMPADLPQDFKSLVDALLLPANIRLTYQGIQEWLAGKPIRQVQQPRNISYPRLTVRPASGAPYEVDTPAALARFLRDEPVAGERFLYAWNMKEWASSDAGLVADLTDIVEKEFPKNRAAGRLKAAYLLDSNLAFTAPDGTVCSNYAELSGWLEGDASRPKGLTDPAHPLWLYLTTRPEKELREAMAELDADVRQGRPEATAVIRHYLMQYASAGSWTDSDGVVISDLNGFIARLSNRAGDYGRKLLDPADPLSLWLDTQVPGTAERVGRLRALDRQTLGSLSAIDWVPIALNQVKAIRGLNLTEPEDAWREDIWPQAPGGHAALGKVLDGWWRVVHDGRFETAAYQWLKAKPQSGARRQVAIALLANDWGATAQPLSGLVATIFAALPPKSSDPADAAVVQAAGTALAKRLDEIRDSTPQDHRPMMAVEASTALAQAAAAARDSAPGWWDALLAWTGGQLTDSVRNAFATHQASPNVLADLIARRNELQRALTAFRLPVLSRWSTEDSRREALTRELTAQEAKTRDGRLQAVVDKAITLRGTPHADTLTKLKSTQPNLVRTLHKIGVALLIGFGTMGAALFVAGPNYERELQPPQDIPILIALPIGWLAATISGYMVGRAIRGRGLGLIGAVIAGYNAGRIIGLNGILFQFASVRGLLGLLVVAILAIALLLRWLHVRKVSTKVTADRLAVPAELAAGVKKAAADAETLGRDSLRERWLMLHAVLALAVDPAQVQLNDIPGGPARAA